MKKYIVILFALLLIGCKKEVTAPVLDNVFGVAQVVKYHEYKTIMLPIKDGARCVSVKGKVSPYTNAYMFWRIDANDSIVIMLRDITTPAFEIQNLCLFDEEIDSVRLYIGGCTIISQVEYQISYHEQ